MYSSRKQVEPAADQRAREVAALQALGLAVSASLSLDQVWAAALRGVLEAVQPDLAFLFLREGERLVLREVLPSEARPRLGIIHEHRVGECLCGLAVRDGGPIYSRDIHGDPRCTWEECKQAGIRSFAALPLRCDEEIIGVIGLASLTLRVFETQAGFLETLAHQVSVALANARLYEAAQLELNERKRVEEILKRRDRQLQILTQTTRTINATLEIPVVLRQLVASAIELTEAESGAAGLIVNNQAVHCHHNRCRQLCRWRWTLRCGMCHKNEIDSFQFDALYVREVEDREGALEGV